VLVSGYSGIGKSSVVHELHKVLVPPRGLFASRQVRSVQGVTYLIPRSRKPFQSLIRAILTKSEAELNSWREGIS